MITGVDAYVAPGATSRFLSASRLPEPSPCAYGITIRTGL